MIATTSANGRSSIARHLTPLVRERQWLHLCNGLDPVRDGGMVPSILGMTGALSRLNEGVTIVTPTPSRLDQIQARRGIDPQRARRPTSKGRCAPPRSFICTGSGKLRRAAVPGRRVPHVFRT